MSEALVLLSSDDSEASGAVHRELLAGGGRVAQIYGQSVLIVEANSTLVSALESQHGVVGVYRDTVPADVIRDLDETAKLGVEAWNQRQQFSFGEAKRQRKGEGLSWGHSDFEREG